MLLFVGERERINEERRVRKDISRGLKIREAEDSHWIS